MIYAKSITGDTLHAEHKSGVFQDGKPDGREYVLLTLQSPGRPDRGALLDLWNASELLASLNNAYLTAKRKDQG
jgi:hypothetical protein